MAKADESLLNKYKDKVVLTGDRPTGPLHLGHWVGSLKSRVSLQKICNQFIIIADVQALTDNAHRSDFVRNNVEQLVFDYMSCGLEPDYNTFFVQSQVPALYEITAHYMNLVTVARLQRNPTIKQEILDKGLEDSVPAGFFCHPVSQAADITAFQADLVPVGEDQKPLIEQSNEIVRKFHLLYGPGCIKEVEAMIGTTPRLMGIDGHAKASKSLNNAIFLSDDTTTVRNKVHAMYTDPNHIHVSDPGQVEGNMVFHYLDAFYDDAEHLAQLKRDYTKGGLGDMVLKKLLTSVLEKFLEPIRERRARLSIDMIRSILVDNNKKAAMVANATLDEIRERIGIYR